MDSSGSYHMGRTPRSATTALLGAIWCASTGHGATVGRSTRPWLRAIRSETDLSVPEALTTRDGATIVEASAAGETRVCSVLRWMDGRILEGSARPVHLRRLGSIRSGVEGRIVFK